MSARGRFRYGLEPLRLTCQWTLDDLRVELEQENAALDRAESAAAEDRGRAAQARKEWVALVQSGRPFAVQQFALHAGHIAQLARAAEDSAAQAEAQVQRRADAVERLLAAQRARDAIEQHRSEQHAQFIKDRLAQEFKQADEQWGILQAGRSGNDD